MADEGLVPSPEEEIRRKNAIEKLKQIVMEWIKSVAHKRQLHRQHITDASATVLTYGLAQLFDLAVAFLPGLDASEIDLLFIAVKPALKNSDGFLLRKLEELLNLMIDVLPSCHFSAKRHRLNCLYFLIVHVSKDESEQMRRNIISSFLTEIVLALKEVMIFFSAHGVPVSYVEDAGDPYRDQMEECILLIMQELKSRRINNDHTLAYQSRVGPVQWLKPYTDEVLVELGKKGVKSLLAVPVRFKILGPDGSHYMDQEAQIGGSDPDDA